MINKFFGYGSSNFEMAGITLDDNTAKEGMSKHLDTGVLPMSKIAPTMIEIVNSIRNGNLAMGYFEDKFRNGVVEYIMPDGSVQLVIHNSITGEFLSTVYTDEDSIAFKVTSEPLSALGIVASVIPALLDKKYDDEFPEAWETVFSELDKATPNKAVLEEKMRIISTSLFARTNHNSLGEGLFIKTEPPTGEFKMVKPAAIKSGTLNPTTVLYGEFTILEASVAGSTPGTSSTVKKASASAEDLVGAYKFGEEVPEHLKDLIPTLDSTVVVPPMVHDICKIVSTTDTIRNIGFSGPAGTGKTMMAKMIAAGLNKPHFIKTCSANDEISDFTGMLIPVTENIDTASLSSSEKSLISDIVDLGGINKRNICESLGLPTVEDMFFDTEGAYEELTGRSFEGVTKEAAIATWQSELNERVMQFVKTVQTKSNTDANRSFKFVESPLIQALKFGGVCELQEPNVIIQPGVLVGLNSLMENAGTIQLPTGEKIRRHNDAVVVLTTNGNYEGCREMNQSVKSRLHLMYKVDQPNVEVMAARVAAKTGFEDETALQEMAQIVVDIAESMADFGITDGSCGPRELENWATVAKVTGDIYNAGITCVISKVSDDVEAQETCLKRLSESSFAPKRRKRKI